MFAVWSNDGEFKILNNLADIDTNEDGMDELDDEEQD